MSAVTIDRRVEPPVAFRFIGDHGSEEWHSMEDAESRKLYERLMNVHSEKERAYRCLEVFYASARGDGACAVLGPNRGDGMSAQHTPGPWQLKHLDHLQVCDSDGEKRGCAPIARIAGGKNAETRAEARANARLIAAAPELLAALEIAIDQMVASAKGEAARHGYEFCEERSDAIVIARAAIAKATGEQA